MNYGFKLHTDGTLEITMPKGVKVGRVLVLEAGTKEGTLMYPDCDDCIKHGGYWECDHVNCHKGDVPDINVGDTISRQAAIDYLTIKANMTGSYGYISAKEIHDYLSCIPSAESERKTGKWIDTDNYYQRWKCSNCGNHTRDAAPFFCSWCGAKMEGVEDE